MQKDLNAEPLNQFLGSTTVLQPLPTFWTSWWYLILRNIAEIQSICYFHNSHKILITCQGQIFIWSKDSVIAFLPDLVDWRSPSSGKKSLWRFESRFIKKDIGESKLRRIWYDIKVKVQSSSLAGISPARDNCSPTKALFFVLCILKIALTCQS